jgi:hypothetical protein
MRRLHIPRGLPLALIVTLIALLALQSLPPAVVPVVHAPITAPRSLPVAFEPNAGQADAQVRYLARPPGGTLLFAADQIVLAVPHSGCRGGAADCPGAVDHTPRCAARGGVASPPPPGLVRIRFDDALPTVALTAAAPLAGRASYFQGNNTRPQPTDLPTYAELTYTGLYPGIDLRYDGTGNRLKGTYTVAPGADPTHIRWHYEGATDLHIDSTGDLRYTVGDADPVVEQAPVAWQERTGQRHAVPVRYTVTDEGEVGFTLGPYDTTQALLIDPTLIYATTVGGSGNDDGWAIAVDRAGNTYVAGETTSVDFPAPKGFQPGFGGGYSDVFVIKLNPAGDVVYSTYLGGGGEDMALGISVDSAGNAYLAGSTGSPDFPLANPVQPTYGGGSVDGFLTELNAAGTGLIVSTFLGGNYDDCTVGLAADAAGNLYTAGYTASTNFPVVNAVQATNGGSWDAFATKLGGRGTTIQYSTYLGGSDYELVSGFALDAAGNVIFAGETASLNFPTHNAVQAANAGEEDAFVSKLGADGALVYSTYLGGSGEDANWAVTVDGAGSAYISGSTHSPDFPTRNAVQPEYAGDGDAFLTKLSSTGTALVYSTYLGGAGEDWGRGVAVDQAGNAYLDGMTDSADFPLIAPWQAKYGGKGDAFVAALDAGGATLHYTTFIGGSGEDDSRSLALDTAGNVYLTGYTNSPDFPAGRSVQPATAGGHEVFVVGLSPRAFTTPHPFGTR